MIAMHQYFKKINHLKLSPMGFLSSDVTVGYLLLFLKEKDLGREEGGGEQ